MIDVTYLVYIEICMYIYVKYKYNVIWFLNIIDFIIYPANIIDQTIHSMSTNLLFAIMRHARARPQAQMGVHEVRALCTSSCRHPVFVKPSELMRITILTIHSDTGVLFAVPRSVFRRPGVRCLINMTVSIRYFCRLLMNRQEKHIRRT